MPKTYWVKTGGGGRQFYFEWSTALDKVTTTTTSQFNPLGRGLDTRGAGGYVLVPGSNHKSGGIYEVGEDLPLASCPHWLLFLLDTDPRADSPKAAFQTLSEVPEGGRNDYLKSFAGKMWNVAGSYEVLLASVLAENDRACKPPCPRREVETVCKSISNYEQHEPFSLELHDKPLAETFAAHAKDSVRHLADDQNWMAYEGGLWVEKPKGPLYECAEFFKSLIPPPDACERKVYVAIRKILHSERQIVRVLHLASVEPGISCHSRDFDPDPMMLALPGGLCVDLRTGRVRPSRTQDLFTRSLTVVPAGGVSLEWERFLEEILPDPSVRSYWKRLNGYYCTSSNKEEQWTVAHGGTATGKNTATDPIRTVLGRYCIDFPILAFMDETGEDRKQNYLARLLGVRLAICNEGSKFKRLDSRLIKSLVSDAVVTGRRLGHDPITFPATHKILMLTNDRPVLDLDDAMRRRVQIVPFTRKWGGKDKPDPSLKEFFSRPEQLSGIAKWMVEGCLEWQERGLDPPSTVLENTESYFQEFDIMEKFLAEHTEEDPGAFEPTLRLFAHWKWYCEATGEPKSVGSEKTFVPELLAKRPKLKKHRMQTKGKQTSGFYGIKLTGAANEQREY